MLKIIVAAIGGIVLGVGLAFAVLLWWWDAKTGLRVVEQSAVIERNVIEADEGKAQIGQAISDLNEKLDRAIAEGERLQKLVLKQESLIKQALAERVKPVDYLRPVQAEAKADLRTAVLRRMGEFGVRTVRVEVRP